MPTLQDEVTYISGVNPDGTLARDSFAAWNQGTNPADYGGGYTNAAKWFASPNANKAGISGGTVSYYFDPASHWTATEQQAFISGLALWSAVANISFAKTSLTGQAELTFRRGSDGGAYASTSTSIPSGAGLTGGSKLEQITGAEVSIDTSVDGFGPIGGSFTAFGGYAWQTVLHEEGHALGLEHAGPYPLTTGAQPEDVQYSPYDSRMYSVMSYIDPWTTSAAYYSQYPVSGTNWGTVQDGGVWYYNEATSLMQADILAAQRLYGLPTTTPLSGGQVFGFNTNITGDIRPFFDFTQNTKPVVTLWDMGADNTLDLSGFSDGANVNLNPGTFSSAGGMTNNIAIAQGTRIDTAIGGVGNDRIVANNNGDHLYGGLGDDTLIGGAGKDFLDGGLGNDVLNGGANIDTAVFVGNRAAYTIAQTSDGRFTVTGPDGTDTLSNIEYLQFADLTTKLLPGQGTRIDFSANPSTYMAPIRDYDGNDLTGQPAVTIDPSTGAVVGAPAWDGRSGWTLVGTTDVNGSGTTSHILFNNQIGRWAEVATEGDGLTYFDNHGLNGDTRIVGIYQDPLIKLGIVTQGGEFDSQARFQHDLVTGNIDSILGAGDYNHDGFQEIYFGLGDGTAYLHALMWKDGNIQYANYQTEAQVKDYLGANGLGSETWGNWFPDSQTSHEAPLTSTSTLTDMLSQPQSNALLAVVKS